MKHLGYHTFRGRIYCILLLGLLDSTLDLILHGPQGVADAKAQGGKVAVGGEVIDGPGNFVQPTVIESTHDMEVVNTELFAPILHVCKVKVRQCRNLI